jgi:hypothetical protein
LHGGRFEIDSEIGNGTIITIVLPAARFPAEAASALADQPPIAAN